MFGFAGGALCSFYITDMVLVWADTLTPEKNHKKALELGITGFDEEKYRVLKQNLASAFNESASKVRFPDVSLTTILVEVKLSKRLVWPFTAHICDLESALDFFRGICGQSLANHGLSLYKQFQLENMIHLRDEYVLYLEENYKTVNGTELMEKYRRQHPESAKLLTKYTKTEFDSTVGSRYAEYLNQTTTNEPRLWKEFDLLAKHQKEWATYSQDSEETRNHQEEHEDKSVSEKSAETRQKRRRSDADEDSKRIKLEPEEEKIIAHSQSPSKRISPTKRKRLGLVGKR